MPTYRSITISLISQFDILTIPEFAPPTTPTDPFSNAPTLINQDHSLVSVYVPTYPSSQFWLSYSISPPHPPKLLYYFKLYLNGNPVVSWGCGEDDDYRGKTMFGLFKPGRTSSLTKSATLERRVLCFSPNVTALDHLALDNLSDVMEIKVFRSKARKRFKPEVRTLQSTGISPNLGRKRSTQQQAAGGINLVNAGALPDKHPQRYYRYALLDPLDVPFATFRYYYRSWEQLEALGVISPDQSESSSVTSIDSSPVRSQQNVAAIAERPLSPRDSSNTLESYSSISASSESTATNDVLHVAEDPKNSSTVEAATATNPNMSSPKDPQPSKTTVKATPPKATSTDTASQSTTDSPEASSPLKIPFFLPRPPTPPPTSTPPKLSQLPNIIPPTTRDLNTLASKDSFASLIRHRLPDPDPSSFQLSNPAESTQEQPSSGAPATATTLQSPQHRAASLGASGKRSGTGSMGVLMNVVNSAKNRRRREAGAADGAAGEDEGGGLSGSERTDAETGESVSVGSGSEGSGKPGGKCGGGDRGKEKKQKKKKKKRGEKEKGRGEEEGEGEGENIDKKPEERKRRERKRNLWEEL